MNTLFTAASMAALSALLAGPVLAQATSGSSSASGTSGNASTVGAANTGTSMSGSGTGSMSSTSTGNTAGTMSGTGTMAGTNNTNWNTENTYWRNNYASRPYYSSSRNYSVYEPAYRYGVELYNQNPGRRFDEIDQAQMRSGWDRTRGTSNLNWTDAQMATRDAYDRLYNNRSASIGTGAGAMSPSSGTTGGNTSATSSDGASMGSTGSTSATRP